jgi:hypothetical protein
MMFAVAVMDPTIKMLFYAAAVALFVLAAIGFERGKVSFVAAGLAAFAFPFFWDGQRRPGRQRLRSACGRRHP